MISMLRILPNQLVSNSFKFLPECRFISKIVNKTTFLLQHEQMCKEVKERTKIGKILSKSSLTFYY